MLERPWLALAGAGWFRLLVAISCSTVNRTVVQLPNFPGRHLHRFGTMRHVP